MLPPNFQYLCRQKDQSFEFRMSKEFRSLGVFAAFSRWSLEVSLAVGTVIGQVPSVYRPNSYTPKFPNSNRQVKLAKVKSII